MWILLDLALALMAVGFVVVPLLREERGGATAESPGEDRLVELEERARSLKDEMEEVEFDFRAGKLVEADYADLVDRERQDAARVAGEIEKAREPARAVSRGREAEAGRKGKRFCSACGARTSPAAKFCASCGKPV